MLASAGVDVPHLFAQYGMRTGEGGPFIPAPRGAAVPDTTLTPEKLAALQPHGQGAAGDGAAPKL